MRGFKLKSLAKCGMSSVIASCSANLDNLLELAFAQSTARTCLWLRQQRRQELTI